MFLYAIPVAAVCLALSLVLEEHPLSKQLLEIAEGKIDVQEY